MTTPFAIQCVTDMTFDTAVVDYTYDDTAYEVNADIIINDAEDRRDAVKGYNVHPDDLPDGIDWSEFQAALNARHSERVGPNRHYCASLRDAGVV